MKDTALPTRKAYYAAISALGYNVFDLRAPDTATKPYIILGTQTNISENTKTSFDNRVSINIDIINSFDDSFGGRKPVDLIATEILEAINPAPGQSSLNITGFNVLSTSIVADFTFEPNFSDTETIYRRVITIEHLLEQV